MSNSLGALVVSLGLDAAEYVSGMTKSEYVAKKTMQRIGQEAATAAKVIGGLTVVAAGVTTALVKMSIDSADSLSKMAQSAGVTIDVLSELAYAADLSGVSADTLGTSMARLNRNVSDAASGTGEAMKAFDALGISATDAQGKLKNADQVMEEVADQFVGMEDGAGKSALAIMLFGRAGAALIPLLNTGSRGIKEMREEARALGLTLDTETGRAAEQFNDNLTRLGAAKSGLSNALMTELLPTLNLVTDAMVDIAKGIVGAANEAKSFEGAGDSLARSLAFIGDAGMSVAAIFRLAGSALAAFGAMKDVPWGKGWSAQITAIREAAEEDMQRILDSTTTFRDALDRVMAREPKDNWDLMGRPRGRAAPGIANTSAASKAAAEAKRLAAAQLREAEQIAKIQAEAIEELDRATSEAFSFLPAMEAKLKKRQYFENIFGDDVTGSVEELEARFRGLIDGVNALENSWVEAGLAAGGFDENGKLLVDTLDKASDSGKAFGQIMSSSLEDLIFNSEKAISVMGLLEAAALDVAKAIFREHVTNPLAKAGAGIFDKLLQGLSGGSPSPSVYGGIYNEFAGARAGGGPVFPGKSYLVGERGPELFMPGASGSIIPNGAGGGVTVIQHNRIDSGTDSARVGHYMAVAQQRAVAAMQDLQRRTVR